MGTAWKATVMAAATVLLATTLVASYGWLLQLGVAQGLSAEVATLNATLKQREQAQATMADEVKTMKENAESTAPCVDK